MEPKQLTCADCGQNFEFSVEEQQFFAEKGFGEPKRCQSCRRAKKDSRRSTFTKVTCSACGVETEVPFVPKGDRPVLCRACFEAKGGNGGASRGGRGGRSFGPANDNAGDTDMAA